MKQRVKSGLAVTQKHLSLCDNNLRKAEADSRNTFVEKAIEFYAGYLNAEQNPKFFDEIFVSKVQQKVEQIGKSLGTGQYKIAVELAVLSHIVASQVQMTEAELRRLRENCADGVKRLGSVPSFEQEYRFQHSNERY